ncbi:LAFA_0F12332g1_1 [Lachancea sp. 'fantastica']|nr:LAFA_0F12332g1_1 [Lachancea sp. 'fantastica']
MQGGSDPCKEEQQLKRACVQCKTRKKKCSGQLPCSYCIKIDKPQLCEYRARRSSKRINVTVRYVQSLKARIHELEQQLEQKKTTEDFPLEKLETTTTSRNPLIENEDSDDLNLSDVKNVSDPVYVQRLEHQNDKLERPYTGYSSCAKFLQKVSESIVGQNTSLPWSNEASAAAKMLAADCLQVRSGFHEINQMATDRLPTIAQALRLLSVADETIGADYMYLDPDYATRILEPIIYATSVPADEEEIIRYVTEMSRFYSYLALGSLFDRGNTRPRLPGLLYFETGVSLQGFLQKAYDQATSSSLIQTQLYLTFYSLSLNKMSFAFNMIGIAIRMAFSLGFHEMTGTLDQNRTFWLCFVYDRLISIRKGLPFMIEESEIKIPFLDAADETSESISLRKFYLAAHVGLAKITTNIIRKIYTRNSSSFVQNCCDILCNLQSWRSNLPGTLKLDHEKIEGWETRSIFNLHINYNYSLIVTTRPVLFYVFQKSLNDDGKRCLDSDKLSGVVSNLVDACTKAAEIQSRILTKLFHDQKFAVCSFLDCHFIFNATVILILRAYCQSIPTFEIRYQSDATALFDLIQLNLKVLSSLSEHNVAASHFNEKLTDLLKLLRSKGAFADVLSTKPRNNANSSDRSQEDNFDILWEDEAVFEDRFIDTFEIVDIAQVLNGIENQGYVGTENPFLFEDNDFLRSLDSL